MSWNEPNKDTSQQKCSAVFQVFPFKGGTPPQKKSAQWKGKTQQKPRKMEGTTCWCSVGDGLRVHFETSPEMCFFFFFILKKEKAFKGLHHARTNRFLDSLQGTQPNGVSFRVSGLEEDTTCFFFFIGSPE